MKKLAITVMILSLFTVGCAGLFREKANPVLPYQYGDDDKTCGELEQMLISCKDEYLVCKKKRNSRLAANGIIAVTSVIILPAMLLTMDISGIDAIERDAQAVRYDSLTKISVAKKCTFKIPGLQMATKEEKHAPHAPTNDH